MQRKSVGSVDASAGLGVAGAVTGNGSVPSVFSERLNVAAISLPVEPQDLSVEETEGLGSAASNELINGNARLAKLLPPASDQHPGRTQGSAPEKEEASLDNIMKSIQALTVSVAGQFVDVQKNVQDSIENVRSEVATVHGAVVTLRT